MRSAILPLLPALAAALFLFACRLVLFIAYPDDFRDMSSVGTAFMLGACFDVLVGSALFLWTTLAWLSNRTLVRVLIFAVSMGLWWFTELLALIGLFYHGMMHRHVGAEVLVIEDDLADAVRSIVADFLFPLLGWIASCVLLAWFWWRLLRRVPAGQLRQGALALLVWLGCVVTCAFGQDALVGAAFSGSLSRGLLVLNAPLYFLHAVWPTTHTPPRTETTADHAPSPTSGSALVILLESWDIQVVDSYRRLNGEPFLGLTPHFDAAAEQGLLVEHCYASGQRSIEGIGAVLTALPAIPLLPLLGRGLDDMPLRFLPAEARAHGARTFFVQGSPRASFRMDQVSARVGIEHYAGAEDILSVTGHALMPAWGAWDEDTFSYVKHVVAQAPGPFLGVVFTASTHHPYQSRNSAGGESAEFTSAERGRIAPSVESRYHQSIRYADQTLGDLLAWLSREVQPQIVVVTADHPSGLHTAIDPPGLHRIPCLAIGASITPGRAALGAQTDIWATIAQALAWPQPSFGVAWQHAAPRQLLVGEGALMAVIDENGWEVADRTQVLAQSEGARGPLVRTALQSLGLTLPKD